MAKSKGLAELFYFIKLFQSKGSGTVEDARSFNVDSKIICGISTGAQDFVLYGMILFALW